MLATILPLLVRYWPFVTTSVVLAFLLNNKYWKNLNKYPGHWAAPYSNLWRLWDVNKRNHHWTNIALHRKHGDVVRLGPNVLSFADPAAIKAIYGLNKGVYKVRRPYRTLEELSAVPDTIPVRFLPRTRSGLEGPTTLLSVLHDRRRFPRKVPPMR